MCYVGKATKIFIFIIIVLAVLGLVLGFTVFRHKTHNSCDASGCSQPDYAEPIPVPAVLAPPAPTDTPVSPTPLLQAAPPPPPYTDGQVVPPPPQFNPPDTPAPVVVASPPPNKPPDTPPPPVPPVAPGPVAR